MDSVRIPVGIRSYFRLFPGLTFTVTAKGSADLFRTLVPLQYERTWNPPSTRSNKPTSSNVSMRFSTLRRLTPTA